MSGKLPRGVVITGKRGQRMRVDDLLERIEDTPDGGPRWRVRIDAELAPVLRDIRCDFLPDGGELVVCAMEWADSDQFVVRADVACREAGVRVDLQGMSERTMDDNA